MAKRELQKRDVLNEKEIRDRIYLVRGLQVMFDEDLAELYQVKTGRLNEQVKRNKERFPKKFMFQLNENEYNILISQIATSSSKWGGRRKLPYAFTEQGVAMLSGVLKSDTAVKISIRIMDAFVAMRKFISLNAQMFQRMDIIEKKQIESDKRIDRIFDIIQSKDIKPEKGIFFDGQIFDAHKFFSDIIRSANNSIVLIDNYIDDSVLTLFGKRKKGVKVVEEKDLGKKWFAFSKFDREAFTLLDRLELELR